jgi:plasmid stabilization system protein ParE
VVTITRKAELEIIEAIAYYAKIEEKLGLKVREEIRSTIKNITANPLIYPIVYKTYRRALTRNFAFAVYYTVETNDYIVIDAIVSQKISTRLLKLRLG